MKKAIAVISMAAASVMCSPCVYASPATGNTEKSTYIAVIAGAGVLAVAAAIVGILTKKKKK